jgi:hypothetical protein
MSIWMTSCMLRKIGEIAKKEKSVWNEWRGWLLRFSFAAISRSPKCSRKFWYFIFLEMHSILFLILLTLR